MVNVLSGSKIEKAAIDKLRDIGKLYNFEEEEVEIAEKEIIGSNNQKTVAGKEDLDELSLTKAKRKRKERFEEQNKEIKERDWRK